MLFKLHLFDGCPVLVGIGNNGKIYYHAKDVAIAVRKTHRRGRWVEKVASCKLGDILPEITHSLTRENWVIEHHALVNVMEKEKGPEARKLYLFLMIGYVVPTSILDGKPQLKQSTFPTGIFYPYWIDNMKNHLKRTGNLYHAALKKSNV